MSASLINLAEVGAWVSTGAGGTEFLRFGLYLPGITYPKGYRVQVRVIHEADQLVRDIGPQAFYLNWHEGSPLDLWDISIDLSAPPPNPASTGHFGQPGVYLYRLLVLRGDRPATRWFADPFGRAAGLGGLSAVA